MVEPLLLSEDTELVVEPPLLSENTELVVEDKVLLVSDGVAELLLAAEPLLLSEDVVPVVEDKPVLVAIGLVDAEPKLAHIASRIPSPSNPALSSVVMSKL